MSSKSGHKLSTDRPVFTIRSDKKISKGRFWMTGHCTPSTHAMGQSLARFYMLFYFPQSTFMYCTLTTKTGFRIRRMDTPLIFLHIDQNEI